MQIMIRSLLANPYALIGGGAVVLSIAGSLYYQSLQIHHYHQLYDAAVKVIVERDKTIRDMTTAQNQQLVISQDNLNHVLQTRQKAQPIINKITTAPSKIVKGCPVPQYPKEVTDAF
jgi:hypothetical protein